MAGARQPGLAAGEAWANCVVSHTIIQHADRSTQAILARSRYIRYSKAVRHIGKVTLAHMSLPPLLLAYPSLRSFGGVVQGGRFCSWKVNGTTDRVEACVMLAADPRLGHWNQEVTSVTAKLPDDWHSSYRCASITVIDDRGALGLQQSLTVGTISIDSLKLDILSISVQADLVKTIASSLAPKCRHIEADAKYLAARGKLVSPNSSELTQALGRLQMITDSVTLIGLWARQATLMALRAILRSFHSINIATDPWADIPPNPEVYRMEDKVLYAAKGFALQRFILRIFIDPATHKATTLAQSLDYIEKDKIWLRRVAQMLLTIGGPTVDYSLVLCNNAPAKFASTAADVQRLERDSAVYTRRLNDIIESYIECRRSARPAGWKRLAAWERRAAVSRKSTATAVSLAPGKSIVPYLGWSGSQPSTPSTRSGKMYAAKR